MEDKIKIATDIMMEEVAKQWFDIDEGLATIKEEREELKEYRMWFEVAEKIKAEGHTAVVCAMGTDIGAFIMVNEMYELWPIEDTGMWKWSELSEQTRSHFNL